MNNALKYLELILTAVGVVVVIAVFALFRNMEPWKAAAVCAVAVSVVHGVIFYGVRARQRRMRAEAVVSIRSVLDDLVQNKLSVRLFPPKEGQEDWISSAQRAVWEIQARLNYIDREYLKSELPVQESVHYNAQPPRQSGETVQM
jgi:predicted membrane channel-forming protein YqfA (hemolysin III family)